MDVRLSADDIYLDAAGCTEYLSGVSEAVQRVQIAALTAKGSYIYDRSFGTDYASLMDRTMLKERLDMLIKEAAAGIADTDVAVLAYDPVRRMATLRVTCARESIMTEVFLHGIL